MGYMTSQYRKVEPARIDQRGMVRQPVELHRRVRCRRSEKRVEGCLADISIYGCRVNLDNGEADDPVRIKVGERVWLNLGNSAPVGATTIWCDGDMVGCRFDNSLDRTLFRQLTLLSG